MIMLQKAVFIDKDGTLIPDIPYNVNPDLIKLHSGAAEGLRLLQQNGYLIIIISNQSGVGRGYFKEEALVLVQQKLEHLLKEQNIQLSGFYYCPHYVGSKLKQYDIACDCRKPAPGMLLKAAKEFSIDLSLSWMIGDILNDVEAGKKAGCKTVLIDNGGETEWQITKERTPDITTGNIYDAAQKILESAKEVINADQ